MLNMARYLLLLLLLACPLHAVVSSPTSATSYQGAGTTPAYPYTWGISQPSDLVCYELIVATGAITKLNLTADYTVSGVGIYTGGTVTLTAGNLPTGTSLLIASDPAQVQLLLLQQGAPFNPADLMNALDYLTREVQATRRVANNAIQIPLSESVAGLNTTLPSVALRANTFPIFDNAGNITVSASPISVSTTSIPTSQIVQVVANVASLRALAITPATGQIYATRGYATTNDGGQAQYVWNSSDTTTDNGGTVLQITGVTTGRLNLQWSGALNIRWFGATGNGTTDDTTAIQAAVTIGHRIFIPNGTYKTSASISLPNIQGQEIYGESMLSAIIAPTGSAVGFLSTSSFPSNNFHDFSITSTSTGNGIDISSGEAYLCIFRNLTINTIGKCIYAPTAFSLLFDSVFFSSTLGNGIETVGSVSTTFVNCYANNFSATGIPYRVYGACTMIGCNGIDSGGIWGLFGSSIAKGDAINQQYAVTLIGCNWEACQTTALTFRDGGYATLINCTGVTPVSGNYTSTIYIENTYGFTIMGCRLFTGGATRSKLADVFVDTATSNGVMPKCIDDIVGEYANVDYTGVLTAVPVTTTAIAASGTAALTVGAQKTGREYGFYSPIPSTWTANAATFAVTGDDRIVTANTGSTNFTNATGGVVGQMLVITVADTHTTIKNASGGAGQFINRSGADITASTGQVFTYFYNGSSWVQPQ